MAFFGQAHPQEYELHRDQSAKFRNSKGRSCNNRYDLTGSHRCTMTDPNMLESELH